MKYCILWALTFGIATFFQLEKPIKVYTGYVSSVETFSQGNLRTEVIFFNIILRMECNTSCTQAEAEINIKNFSKTRNVKVLISLPQWIITTENLLIIEDTISG
jgi:hypothetical protein